MLESWPTPAVFSAFDYGRNIFSGRDMAESAAAGRNPVRDIFAENLPTKEQMEKDPAKWHANCYGPGGRSSWDETAVLIAVRGWEKYCNVERGCFRMVGNAGADEWVPDAENGRHLRIIEKVSKEEVGRVIDELICRKPQKQ